MSQYHTKSNPFEDEEEGANDFVVVDKKSSGQNQASSQAAMKGSSSSSGAYQRTSSQQNYRPHNPPNSYSPYSDSTTSNYSDEDSPFEDKRQNLIRQIENSENTQLESTHRALASLYDSEAMGIATAEV